MYDDDSDGFDLFLGLILWVPYLVWLWLKFTFMILEFVYGAVVAIGTVLYFIIKEIIELFTKLVTCEKIAK